MISSKPIFTVGHSTHTVEKLIHLLQAHGVTAVADVRSSPRSTLNPQFNREALQKSLKAQRIAYAFLGKELGARSEDPGCYEDGKVKYRRLAATSLFRQGVDRLRRGMENYRIALLCAEKEPLFCHRAILVARELQSLGISVEHIHGDGHLERHSEAMVRLLDLLGLAEKDFFQSDAQLFERAYSLQEDRIAYVDGKMTGIGAREVS
ncbi:MAG: DUF488 family protein [Hyalangium sp.]|uniref:DUF488 domain-containing protein n=1 Tax=Hyalangium sp. TaxID=2028555 RepID=UPI00389A1440